jgi:hypothetical protein
MNSEDKAQENPHWSKWLVGTLGRQPLQVPSETAGYNESGSWSSVFIFSTGIEKKYKSAYNRPMIICHDEEEDI